MSLTQLEYVGSVDPSGFGVKVKMDWETGTSHTITVPDGKALVVREISWSAAAVGDTLTISVDSVAKWKRKAGALGVTINPKIPFINTSGSDIPVTFALSAGSDIIVTYELVRVA